MQQAQQPSLRHPTATPVATESAREDRTEFVPPSSWRFASISAGLNYTCGVRVDGSVKCWSKEARRLPPHRGLTIQEDLARSRSGTLRM